MESYIKDPAAQAAGLAVTAYDTTPVAQELDSKQLIEMQTFFGWGSEDVETQVGWGTVRCGAAC